MIVTSTEFAGLYIIQPQIFHDERGYFYESWQQQKLADHNLNLDFVQDNISYSKENVLRAFHYQIKHPFGQLVFVTLGKIFDAVIDLRPTSKTFKKVYTIELSAENNQQLYMPPGFAHGFCTISGPAIVNYKCTGYYQPNDEGNILWNSVGINWPLANPIISAKDQQGIPLAALAEEHIPAYE